MSFPATDSSRPRLILLTQWFEPEPSMKGLAFARRLGEMGFEVEAVTGFPNYPGGKVYDGYRIRPILREKMNGVAVTDEASAIEAAGYAPLLVPGAMRNFKVTWPDDFELMEKWL